MNIALATPWTVERFLAWEDQQEGRHEFDGTQVIAMTGGSRNHQLIVHNLFSLLRASLDRARFEALPEMRVAFGNRVRYPDITVVAAPVRGTTRTLRDAIVLFEVLSDDTAATDRDIKPAEYATIPSLCRYVILDQTRIGGWSSVRAGNNWSETELDGEAVAIPEVNVTLPLSSIYLDVRFEGP